MNYDTFWSSEQAVKRERCALCGEYVEVCFCVCCHTCGFDVCACREPDGPANVGDTTSEGATAPSRSRRTP